MIVRLHNLSARAPVEADLEAVTSLMVACDTSESGIADPTEEDVRISWQSSGFSLKTDAWVIVANKGQIVGYADLHQHEAGQLIFSSLVHPDYRGRGIGTLLIWLVEERARQMMSTLPAEVRVTLSIAVSSMNQMAHHLLEREGYSLLRHYLRLLIELDEATSQPFDEERQSGKIKMDLVVDGRSLMEATPLVRRTGMYVVRQYDVYEKELRAGVLLPTMPQQEMQSVPA